LVAEELEMFLTKDQIMKILKDEALFGVSLTAKIRSVRELAETYGLAAVPLLLEILDTLPNNNDGLKTICLKSIAKIKEEPASSL
jgi:hypothetical protein